MKIVRKSRNSPSHNFKKLKNDPLIDINQSISQSKKFYYYGVLKN